MYRAISVLVLAFWLCASASLAWEIRSDIPAAVQVGTPVELDLWEWIASGDCYVCDGFSVQYGEHSAEVVLTITRVKPWGDPCNGPGDICEYTIPIVFNQLGTSTLTITELVVAPPFGGESQVGQFEIEVQETAASASSSWGALKAVYR